MRKRSVWRSLVAGALIGLADATPQATRVRVQRPLGVVWIDERDVSDPLDALPILLLDPVQVERGADHHRGLSDTLRLTLTEPMRLLRRLRARLSPG